MLPLQLFFAASVGVSALIVSRCRSAYAGNQFLLFVFLHAAAKYALESLRFEPAPPVRLASLMIAGAVGVALLCNRGGVLRWEPKAWSDRR